MNYFYKRYSWLVPLCIVAIWGVWATQVVSAQVDAVDLTASPQSLPATPGGVVTVTITYTVTTPTLLFYYPPFDFEIHDNDGALPDPTNTPPPGLNGSQRLRWDIEGSGSKNVVLQVAAGATVGDKPHRAALANGTTSDDSLILVPFAENTNIDKPISAPENELEDGADDNNNNFGLEKWLRGGVIVVAILLLVAIGIYLLAHARRQAKPAKVIPISVPKGQPSLQSSNGRSFPITSFPFTIGRGEGNNLIIDETFPQWESMSRNHAQIMQHQQGYVIEDLGSQNKLRVQGRLTDRNLLRNGWQILIGGVEFTFYDGSVTPGGSA